MLSVTASKGHLTEHDEVAGSADGLHQRRRTLALAQEVG
jgi:hypothetical protein